MIWFYLLIALQVADGISTLAALRLPGLREANPIVAWLMDRVGVTLAVVAVKGLGVVLAFMLMEYPAVLAALCAAYLYVVAGNIRRIRQARR